MASAPSKTSKSKKNSTNTQQDVFMWSDDEVELLLTITNDYKVSKTYESVDWESVQSKYTDILERFKQQYPSTDENSSGKDFPHKKSDITKLVVTTKLKAIRSTFRQSVDSGKRSGHGRVVWLYYELCESIWGGSPATSSIDTGIESTDIASKSASLNELTDADEVDAEETAPNDDDCCSEISSESSETTQTSSESDSSKQSRNERRALVNEKLKNHKQEKLKRKLPLDSQMLSVAQEELKIKKQLLDKLDNMDQQYSDTMKSLTSNIEKLTNCITDTFSVFKNAMVPQPYMQPVGSPYHVHPQPMGYQPTHRQDYNNSSTMNSASQNTYSQQFTYIEHDHNQY